MHLVLCNSILGTTARLNCILMSSKWFRLRVRSDSGGPRATPLTSIRLRDEDTSRHLYAYSLQRVFDA